MSPEVREAVAQLNAACARLLRNDELKLSQNRHQLVRDCKEAFSNLIDVWVIS